MSGSTASVVHRHGRHAHRHAHGARAHRHVLFPARSQPVTPPDPNGDHGEHGHSHGHAHGLVDRSIIRSRAGVRSVAVSLAVLMSTAGVQIAIFILSGSVALLADLVHNVGDALTAVPLAIAFFLRSERAERWAGYFVVLVIFVSACVAFSEAVMRLIRPEAVSHLWALAAAGAVGFIGNEIAAVIRLRAGHRLNSPALVADGYHARTDGFVSLGVVASAVLVALGADLADPLIGLAITVVILRVTWRSWQTIRYGIHAH
jgi:cation diffusion facilitator family transporter